MTNIPEITREERLEWAQEHLAGCCQDEESAWKALVGICELVRTMSTRYNEAKADREKAEEKVRELEAQR